MKTLSLRVLPAVAAQEAELRKYLARELAVNPKSVTAVKVRKRSIDARQRTIYVNLTVDVYVNEEPPTLDFAPIDYPNVEGAAPVLVVGAGPGGLFAALRLRCGESAHAYFR